MGCPFQAWSIVIKVWREGGKLIRNLDKNAKNPVFPKISKIQIHPLGEGGGGRVSRSSNYQISSSSIILKNCLHQKIGATPSKLNILYKFNKNVGCEKKCAPPPPLPWCYVPEFIDNLKNIKVIQHCNES